MGDPSTAFILQYNNTIYLLAQQMETRLRGAVMVDTNWTGSAKFYDQYNADVAIELNSRYADTPVQLPDFRRRMVTPHYYVSNTLEDPKDALQMAIDPKSTMMAAKAAAFNRATDDLLISALGGTAFTGATGTTSTAFLTANKIVFNQFSSGNGLTKAKVLSASRLMNAAEVDKSDRYLAHTAAQLEDLLNTTEVTSSDYNVVKALVQGELSTWIGFSFIHTERLLTDAVSSRLCYAWQRNGMQLAIQKDIEGRVDERKDKNYAWQVYMRMCMGATRMEELRCVQIACTEAAF